MKRTTKSRESKKPSFMQRYESSDFVKRLVSSVFLLVFLIVYVGLSALYTEGLRHNRLEHIQAASYLNWALTIILVAGCTYELIKALGIKKTSWPLYLAGIISGVILFAFPFEDHENWAFTKDINLHDWYHWYIVFLVILLGVVVFAAIPYFAKGNFTDSWKQSIMLVLYALVVVFGFKGFNQIALSMEFGKDPFPLFTFNTIIWAWGTIIFTDSFAYLGGRKFGKTPLAPKISPKKTWEGSGIGSAIAIVSGSVYALLFFYLLPDYAPFAYIMEVKVNDKGHAIPGVVLFLLTVLISFAGQVGDLFFSWYKRVFGVKDFSNLIPGHGGLLDRLDSFLFVFFILYFISLATF